MQSLFTISYPELSIESAAFIDAFRQQYDADRQSVVGAHFTLLFGCASVDLPSYTDHVAQLARAGRPVTFVCRYAMLGCDDQDGTAYVYLVPDKGFAEISLLHDRLYTGPLAPHLRLDLPYVPHITIGSSQSRTEAKALCDALNRRGVLVEGRLTALTIGHIVSKVFSPLSVHVLGAA